MNSIPKPTYYAYTFLHRLGDTELVCDDENAYVCKSENAVQILLWNIKKPETNEGNRKYFARPLPAAALEDTQVIFNGFEPNKTYTVSVETIGYHSGDAYNAYLEGNFTENPTRKEIAELIEQSKPKKKTFSVTADEKGTLSFPVPQMENSADLIIIE
jgi:xylan 1,4-beta-xylosidase